jgi:cysteine desulfurase
VSRPRAYLDHNATSPLRPEARAAVLAALEISGNASAVHAQGRAARKVIEAARADVASLLGIVPESIVFISGGSEGAATLLAPGLRRAAGRPVERLIVSAVEHSCVLSGGRFAPADVTLCPVDADGLVDLDALDRLLAANARPALVALMLANNETGVVQPVRAAADRVHARGGVLVCDAVQGLGKLPIDLTALGADALFVSGHKIGAPQGVGALVLGSDLRLPAALIRGGTQENRRRAGTENLSGIAGFGAAAAAIRRDGSAEIARMTALRDWMEDRLRTISPETVVLGSRATRLPNTSALALAGLIGETTVIACDLAGVSIAAGSACASGKVAPSHVLTAMGLAPEAARCVVRVSLGWSSTEADVEQFLTVWRKHRDTVFARRARAA